MSKKKSNKDNPALVLGMFETGLGVVRSLGRAGILVYGLDHKKDIGFYSRFVNASICPHPIDQEPAFISFLIEYSKSFSFKPVLFITSDIFLIAVSKNRLILDQYYLFNLPSNELINNISDKNKQYQLAKSAETELPQTFLVETTEKIDELKKNLPYPVLIKALDVNDWRKKVSGSVKGFVAKDPDSLSRIIVPLLEKQLKIIVQEIISGPDSSHFKYCAYFSPEGKPVCEFTLRKIRQNPIRFGVGAVVESISYPELMNSGRKLLESIGYVGVGSAEFKLDSKDGKLKLIELNPRYWQQNYLPTFCGMNFPLYDYLTVTGNQPEASQDFEKGVKWVNRYMDFDSFTKYRKEGELTFMAWRRSLSGKKTYSDFTWDDPIPLLYEIGFGIKLLKIPVFLFKKIFLRGNASN